MGTAEKRVGVGLPSGVYGQAQKRSVCLDSTMAKNKYTFIYSLVYIIIYK